MTGEVRPGEPLIRLREAERALMSEDPAVREAAIAAAGEIVRAAHKAVAEPAFLRTKRDAQS